MKPVSLFARAACAAAALSAFAGTMASAQDSYPIGPGDRLGISFLANPDFDQQVTVGIDGAIHLPLLGELNVGGQTINELREQIPALMTGSVYRERVNGEYLLVSVEPEEVLIDVVEYRPVYFDGAVRRAGQQPFEIGMTVRQGIAAAEGLLMSEDRSVSGSDLRNHPRVLLADLIGILAEMAVHEANLAGTSELDLSDIAALNAPEELIAEAVALAQSQVQTSGDILTEEIGFLETAVQEAEARVIAALRREEVMTEIAETEEAEVARVENLVARSVVSSEALTTARRLYLQAIDRLGGVQAERLQAEASLRELVLERNQAARERALQTQDRLQALAQQAAQLRVRIQLSSGLPSTVALDATPASAPRVVIFRQTGGQSQEVEAALDSRLLPGDVVNVSFQN